MNPYLKHLTKLEFVITDACTGQCKHCSEGDHAPCVAHLYPHLAADTVRSVASVYDLQTVMAFGGEPLLYPDVRFIDKGIVFAQTVKDFADRGKRCSCYTNDTSAETINAIRNYGCLLALISLDSDNFEDAIRNKPDMCEFLHTADFKTIEENYLKKIKLY